MAWEPQPVKKYVLSRYDNPDQLDEGEEEALTTITQDLVARERARRDAIAAGEEFWRDIERKAAEREAGSEAEWAAAEDRAWEIMLANEDGIVLSEQAGENEKVQRILAQFAEHPTYAGSMYLLAKSTYSVKLTPEGRIAGLARMERRDA